MRVRIATTSLGTNEFISPPYNLSADYPISSNMARALEIVSAAGKSGAEICVLPETFRLCGLCYAAFPIHAEGIEVKLTKKEVVFFFFD